MGKKYEKILKTLESHTTPLIKKKALIRQELPSYKELMAQFEKEWDAETAKPGSFTSKKSTDVKSVALKRRSGETGLETQLEKMSVNNEFKWTASSNDGGGAFSFNFDV